MGRPTKCTPEVIEKFREIVQNMENTNTFIDCACVEQLAYHLGKVDERTIYNWRKKNKEFDRVYEEWKATRNFYFIKYTLLGGAIVGGKRWQVSPALIIFLLKNWLGYRDVSEEDIQKMRDVIITLKPPQAKNDA